MNAITVDVEDYFQVTGFEGIIPQGSWDSMELRVDQNTRRIMEVFGRHDILGTFFVLGWIAEKCPDLVRDLAEAGHEIGCHSNLHRQVFRISPEELRKDLQASKARLEDLSGQPVTAFRAPSFSMTQQAAWAWDILYEEGFRVDSSIYPVHHDRYGNPHEKRFLHARPVLDGKGEIIEFPMTTLRLFGKNLPAAGGGYLRLFPLWIIKQAIRAANNQGQPAVVYFHPWEVDPGQPRIKAGWKTRFRHYVNLSKVESRIEDLLGTFRFGTMRESIAARAAGRS